MNLSVDIALALRLADAAGEVIRPWFRAGVDSERKGDASPVTVADRSAEEAMRRILKAEVPRDTVIGEEYGTDEGSSGRSWVLDPIDGTVSFIAGRPIFGTLIALVVDGFPVLGIIDQPISRERWIGVTGKGSSLNGQPIKVRACPSLDKAYMYSTAPQMFDGADAQRHQALAEKTKLFRWGGDCYAYGLLAAGHVDLVVESSLKLYDFAALVPVIKGAGGLITDWRGKELDINSDGSVIAAGDPAILNAARHILTG
jgi:histidinol phosphatase-like enzyme (inositol monophosphatase family)